MTLFSTRRVSPTPIKTLTNKQLCTILEGLRGERGTAKFACYALPRNPDQCQFSKSPPHELRALAETSFETENIMERKDIQRLLREQIAVLDDRLMVIAEEFGDWLDQ